MEPQTAAQTPGTNIDPTALALSRSIRQVESGGDYNAVGDNGTSFGAYQFHGDNFKNWATQFGLDPNDKSATNQDHLAYLKIKSGLDSGLSQSEVAAQWNGAKMVNGRPQAINPNYVKKVQAAYEQQNGSQSNPKTNGLGAFTPQAQTEQAQPAQPAGQTSQPQSDDGPGFWSDLTSGNFGGAAKDAGNFLFPIAGDIGGDINGTNKKSVLQQGADLGISALPFIPGLGELGEGARAADLTADGVEAASKSGLLSKILGSPITKMAGIGAVGGGLQGVANGQDLGGIAQSAGIGGITGGALGGVGSLLSSALGKLPSRIVQNELRGITPETAQYFLDNHSVGSAEKMLADNLSAKESLNSQISSVLKNPQYSKVGTIEDIRPSFDAFVKTINAFPNSDLNTLGDVADAVREVAPTQSKLVDKVLSGSATLDDKNTLRVALDRANYNTQGLPKLTFNKAVANTFSNELRNEVQSLAPETAPLFDQYSKEIKLTKPLKALTKKGVPIISARSLLGAMVGMGAMGGNPLGAAIGYGADQFSRSPMAEVGLAKGLNAAGKVANGSVASKGGLLAGFLASRGAAAGFNGK